MRDGLNLLWVSRLYQRVGEPSEALVDALQHERRLSAIRIGSGTPRAATPPDLLAARRATDAAISTFREQSTSTDAQWAQSDALEQRIAQLQTLLDRLPGVRTSIDAGRLSREDTNQAFGESISTSFLIYGSLSTVDDEETARYGRTLTSLSRARELLSEQDALLAGAAATGQLSAADINQFTRLVGARRFLLLQAAAELPESGRARYDEFADSAPYTKLRELEERLMAGARPGSPPPFGVADWQTNARGSLDGLRDVVLRNAQEALTQSASIAAWVIVRLLLAGGLGLVAVVASVVVSITTARSLVRQLERLRTAAWQLARERLPDVVERLGHGEHVDVTVEAPPLAFGSDEIGQVGQAFNAVQQTAIKVAVQQAELRRSVRDVFLSLARRTQAMVHRQLTLLDVMERQDHGPAVLEDLFRIDHLATRMRRNAENLIVLSGATPGRAWRRAVPMVDVLRGAVAEVEDYTRVTVLPIEPVGLAGRAVGDLIHLIAELVENALSYSPPHTPVQIIGQNVANGYAVEIEDRGLGMNAEDLAAANARIAEPPEFSLAGAAQLGLYVVSRLAERHGIRVRLKDSPYGGITAVVLIPRALVLGDDDVDLSGAEATGEAGNGPAGLTGAPGQGVAGQVEGSGQTGTALATVRGVDTRGGDTRGRNGQVGQHRGGSGRLPDQRPKPHRAPAGDHTLEIPVIPLPATNRHDGEPEGPHNGFTPSGLPVRIRQASLPRQLADPIDGGADDGRSPEDVRKIMSSYQAGTLRGRAAMVEPNDDIDPPTPMADDETR